MKSINTEYPEVDVLISPPERASVCQFFLLTGEVKNWVKDNVYEGDYQPYMEEMLIVERRYVDDLIAGLVDAGFIVKVG